MDSFAEELANEVPKVRKTGLTFAPEAGSQRLRDVINKGITEQDLLTSVKDAFKSGWTRVKLYFMLGLPEETEEDLHGIGDLARKIRDCYFDLGKKGKKALRITISTSSFVPKAFTPFQLVSQDTIEELTQKQEFLQRELRTKNVQYNWNNLKLASWRLFLPEGQEAWQGTQESLGERLYL